MSRLKKSILLLFCSIFVAYFFVGQGSAVAEDQATWAKVYGDTIDYAYDVSSTLQTTEGGYIVTGYVVNLSTYNYDVLVLKLDAGGNIQWQKAYDINNYDFAYSIQQTIDGGYIVAGYTFSVDGLSDALVLKLDANGNIQWQKTYGGSSGDWVYSIQQTTDGGYIIAGATFSFGSYYADSWILKLDSNGNIQWQKAYNKREMDSAYSIQQTTDGGYIVAGQTRVYNEPDIWVLKLDSNGNIMWDNIYGGNSGASASAIVQTTDGGYVVTGRVKAYGEGMYDAWVLKLDGNGNIQWQKTYGGSNYDSAYSIQQTTDGGYILSGNIDSFFAWALRLDMNGNILWQKAYGENGVISSIRQPDGGFIMAGRTSSFGNNSGY